MTKRTRLVGLIVILVIVVAGIVWWQYAKLGRGLRTMPAGTAGEVLISSLSKEVLAPGVDGTAQGAGPLLDQYRKNPELIRQRYRLVMTWVHASKIFKAIGQDPSFKDEMVSSASLPKIPAADRADGWGNPYCIFAGPDEMTFLSSGGDAALNCESLRQTAEQAATTSTDSRLTKDGNLLVAVYKREGDRLLSKVSALQSSL
jgi:hypothetical protein